jgi:hypothetical protein
MILWRPQHAQLRHPLLGVQISDVAKAQSAWQVHRLSFAHLLSLAASAQIRRFPGQLVAYPPETRSFRIDQVAYGFQLLILRHSDLGVLIPELAPFPWQVYPARTFPGGKTEFALVIDGWCGEVTGLLAHTPHAFVQLEGTLKDLEAEAWRVFERLGVVLDATILIRDVRGSTRASLDEHGWTGIPGLRKAAGSYRLRPLPPRSTGPPDDLDNSFGGGAE